MSHWSRGYSAPERQDGLLPTRRIPGPLVRHGPVADIAAHGFAVERSAGVVLYPYWEIPGIDEHARRLTDDDREFAEIMGELGKRAGAEFAYTFVLAARKTR